MSLARYLSKLGQFLNSAGQLITTGYADGSLSQAKLAANVAGNGPAISAYLSGNQTITAATWTKVQFNTKLFDTNTNYDNVTNYRFTPTVAGYYLVTATLFFNSSTTETTGIVGIFKNGSVYSRSGVAGFGGSSEIYPTATSLVYLNGSTDYVEVYGYEQVSSSGSVVIIGGATPYNSKFDAVLARAA